MALQITYAHEVDMIAKRKDDLTHAIMDGMHWQHNALQGPFLQTHNVKSPRIRHNALLLYMLICTGTSSTLLILRPTTQQGHCNGE